jgi:hypothetical protein
MEFAILAQPPLPSSLFTQEQIDEVLTDRVQSVAEIRSRKFGLASPFRSPANSFQHFSN